MKERYQRAVERFVDSVKEDENLIGIILCGSFVSGELEKNSDIDIHLILKEKCEFRERGNTWIEGVEIEYFKNPPQQIRSYFKREKNSPHTADMLAKGKVLLKKSEVIDDLIKEASLIINESPKNLTGSEIEISKYHLDDLRKDLEDCHWGKREVDLILVKNKIIEKCVFILLRLKGVRKGKRKRLFRQIKALDPVFAQKLKITIQEDVLKTEGLKNLIEYTESLLGGKRSIEWILKGSLDI